MHYFLGYLPPSTESHITFSIFVVMEKQHNYPSNAIIDSMFFSYSPLFFEHRNTNVRVYVSCGCVLRSRLTVVCNAQADSSNDSVICHVDKVQEYANQADFKLAICAENFSTDVRERSLPAWHGVASGCPKASGNVGALERVSCGSPCQSSAGNTTRLGNFQWWIGCRWAGGRWAISRVVRENTGASPCLSTSFSSLSLDPLLTLSDSLIFVFPFVRRFDYGTPFIYFPA